MLSRSHSQSSQVSFFAILCGRGQWLSILDRRGIKELTLCWWRQKQPWSSTAKQPTPTRRFLPKILYHIKNFKLFFGGMPKKQVEFYLLSWKVVLANPFGGVRTYMRGTVSGWCVSQEAFVQCVLDPRSFICSEWRRVSSGFPLEKIFSILAKKQKYWQQSMAFLFHIMKHAMPSHVWDEQKLFFFAIFWLFRSRQSVFWTFSSSPSSPLRLG